MYWLKCSFLLRDGALFCGDCGTLCRNITHEPNGSLDSLIKYYFRKEMAYQTVVLVLDACHDIQISLGNLKSQLKSMQLTKSPNFNNEAVSQIIKRQLRGPSAGIGYRFMWYKLKTTYGIQVKQCSYEKYYEKRIQLGHFLENLGILYEGFTYAKVQTTLSMQSVILNSNHVSFLYMVA